MKKIIIVGLPNTGKSVVFNQLTGDYSMVANYAQTTVEVKRATCEIHGEEYEVIDTPGVHCLYLHSSEELVVRDLLLKEKPDIIIQCIDANMLKQSLILTADLLELQIPMVIALNAVHETARDGIWLDSESLCLRLGVPVVETNIGHDVGFKELRAAISEARKGIRLVQYGDMLERGVNDIQSVLGDRVAYPRKTSLLLLLKDPNIIDFVRDTLGQEAARNIEEEVERIHRQFGGDVPRSIANKRSRWVEETADLCTRKLKTLPRHRMEHFAHLSRHPVWGWFILALLVGTTYFLVVDVANWVASALDTLIAVPVVGFITEVFSAGPLTEFLVGPHGILTLGLFNAIFTILPILGVFFLVLAVVEDVGYLPNLCVLVRAVFEKIGLTGNAVMPLVLSFGCKTMATLTTKGLRSRKERYIALYLIAFAIPCAPQMGVEMSILGRAGFYAFVIASTALILFEIGAGLILNRVIPSDRRDLFLQELPPIRVPTPRIILRKTYYRLRTFLKEATPIFLLAAVILFVLDKTHVLSLTKTLLDPLVGRWLGLPLDIVDALILCLARHEAGAGLLLRMVETGALNFIQCIVAVVLTTMFVPCFMNVLAMCKQVGLKTGLLMVLTINIVAFFLAGILNWTLVILGVSLVYG